MNFLQRVQGAASQAATAAASAAGQRARNVASKVANMASQSNSFPGVGAAVKTVFGPPPPRPGSVTAAAAQKQAKANANARNAAALAAQKQAKAKANARNAAALAAQQKANAAAAAAAAAQLQAAKEEKYIEEHSEKLLPSEINYRTAYAAYEELSRSSPMFNPNPPVKPPSYKSFLENSLYKEVVERVNNPKYYEEVLAREKARLDKAEEEAAAYAAANPRLSNPTNYNNFLNRVVRGGRRTRRKRHMKRKQHRTRRHR